MKALYDKHFHGENLRKRGNSEIDTMCQVCEHDADGHQHMLCEYIHLRMRECRHRKTALATRWVQRWRQGTQWFFIISFY